MTATDPVADTSRPPARAATISLVSQLGGKVVHLVLNLVSTLAILRYLAPDAYGSYVLVVTVVTLVGVIADFGLPKLAVREVVAAQDPGDPAASARSQDEVIGTVVVLRLGLAVVAVLACQAVLLALHQPGVIHTAAAVASLVLLLDAVLGVVVVTFQVHVVQQYEALVRVGAEAVETALVLVLVSQGAALVWFFTAPVLGLAVGVTLAVVLARRRFRLRLRPARRLVRHLLVEALPLGPALLIGVLYLKLDSLVLASMRPPRDLGVYSSAYQPVEYLFLATTVIINVMFPLLARAWSRADGAGFARLYRRGTELLVIVTVFVPVVLLFTAPAVVRLAFGSAYADAAGPLRILAGALMTMTVSAWQSLVLLVGGFQRLTLVYNAAALLFAVGLCTLLVWRVGLIGAAVSAVVTSALVVIASGWAVRRWLGVALQAVPLLRILLCAAATVAVLAGLHSVHAPWVVLALVGALVYGGALALFGFHRSILGAFA